MNMTQITRQSILADHTNGFMRAYTHASTRTRLIQSRGYWRVENLSTYDKF